jgi:uncharacterized protein YegJ (DUF2314 family)
MSADLSSFVKRRPFLVGLVLLLAGALNAAFNGPQFVNILLGIPAFWLLGLALQRRIRHRSGDEAEQDEEQEHTEEKDAGLPPTLVLLLDQPREIVGEDWKDHVGEALGVRFETGGDATTFILETPHATVSKIGGQCFMMIIPQGAYWIFHVPTSYVEDPAKAAARIPDKRLATIIQNHQAWLSVDLLRMREDADEAAAYAVIGKTLAALVGPDVLGILDPRNQHCNEWAPELLPKLSSGNPLVVFEAPTFDQVRRIESSSADLEEAIAEAKARWPEFLDYLSKRSADEDAPYIIKAEFNDPGNEENHGEFMWVSVSSVENGVIHGTLLNQPHELESFHSGQTVKLPESAMIDWLCPDEDGKPLGGWTQHALLKNG